ncbi:MAG TPA: C2H2-type zinc finger protein, partial [Methylomirabilota bacterium]|nr:C2H2-type zinc finger protein [Methylomirabilota bacterium]
IAAGEPSGTRPRTARPPDVTLNEAFDPQGPGASQPQTSIKRQEDGTVQCNICGEEVDNSEDLANHMEKMHAVADTEDPEVKENPEVPQEDEVPDPAPIDGRM